MCSDYQMKAAKNSGEGYPEKTSGAERTEDKLILPGKTGVYCEHGCSPLRGRGGSLL